MDQSEAPNGSFRLGFLIHDVSRLRRTVVDKAMKPLDVTRSQWWVLSNLSRDPNNQMMQTELANLLDIGKVALGGLLDRLEAVGYVERRADPHDRRAKRVVMTPKGAAVLKRIQGQATQLNAQMLRDVSAEDISLAEEILHRMKRRLREMDGELKNGSASAAVKDEASEEPASLKKPRARKAA